MTALPSTLRTRRPASLRRFLRFTWLSRIPLLGGIAAWLREQRRGRAVPPPRLPLLLRLESLESRETPDPVFAAA
jgi:hypothetical protein